MKLILISFLLLNVVCVIYGQTWSEGFENQPGPKVSGDLKEYYPGCQGKSNATIDSTVAHSGKKSLRIDGAAGWCDHIWIMTNKSLTGIGKIWYARLYLRVSKGLPKDHVTFITMKDANDGGKDLRFGGIWENLVWNRESDDGGVPNNMNTSVPLTPNKWQCLEFMINGNNGTSQTWLDGKEVPGLHIGNKVEGIDASFLQKNWRPSLQDFRVGWESYGEGTDTLWFDDIALGSTRINC